MVNLNCVICTEILKGSDVVCTTKCGHMFHQACITRWLRRSETCPQCRKKCISTDVRRVYLNASNTSTSNNASCKPKVTGSSTSTSKTQKEIKELQHNQNKMMKALADLKLEKHKTNRLTSTDVIRNHRSSGNKINCTNDLKDEPRQQRHAEIFLLLVKNPSQQLYNQSSAAVRYEYVQNNTYTFQPTYNVYNINQFYYNP